jgi:hypothetical protein
MRIWPILLAVALFALSAYMAYQSEVVHSSLLASHAHEYALYRAGELFFVLLGALTVVVWATLALRV